MTYSMLILKITVLKKYHLMMTFKVELFIYICTFKYSRVKDFDAVYVFYVSDSFSGIVKVKLIV